MFLKKPHFLQKRIALIGILKRKYKNKFPLKDIKTSGHKRLIKSASTGTEKTKKNKKTCPMGRTEEQILNCGSNWETQNSILWEGMRSQHFFLWKGLRNIFFLLWERLRFFFTMGGNGKPKFLLCEGLGNLQFPTATTDETSATLQRVNLKVYK